MKISLTDAAYEYLKTINTSVPFGELYDIAAEKAALAEDMKKRKKNSFYSQLSMDSRFTQQAGNTWDLKEHHSFEETHISVEEIDTDDYEDENEENVLSEDGEEEGEEINSEESAPVFESPESDEEF